MRTLACSALVAVLAGAPGSARANTCSDLKEHPKPPLTFVPFSRDAGSPDDLIEVSPGSRIRAQEAFDSLDAFERLLTPYGYTLRDIEPKTLAELGDCVDLLAGQTAMAEKLLKSPSLPLSSSRILQKIQKVLDLAAAKVPNWTELYNKIKDPNRDVYLPPVPTYSAPTPKPKRPELKPLMKERSWAWEVGEKNSMWVQVQASARIDGATTATKAVAKGAVNAAVLGKWEGEALGADATGSVGYDSIGSLVVNVRAVGKTVFSRTWATGVVRIGDEKRFDAHPEWSFRFSIGPVPCKGTIGFMGAVGVKYGFEIVPIQISAYAVPFASTKVFAQVGVDIVVASAGVGGQLVLIEDSLTLQGSFAVTFEEQPSLVLELSGKDTLNCLSGSLYAFVAVDFWLVSWKGKFDIFKWDGFKTDVDIFKFRTTWGPDGVTAEGDLTAEDVMEVKAVDEQARLADLENASSGRVFEVMDAIAKDLNSSDATEVRSEGEKHQAISAAIDEAIGKYWDELKKSTGGA